MRRRRANFILIDPVAELAGGYVQTVGLVEPLSSKDGSFLSFIIKYGSFEGSLFAVAASKRWEDGEEV